MKAIVFKEHGGVEKLCYTDFPMPEPNDGECLVRVRAVALNGFDPMILNQIPGLKTPLPMIPGGDVSGEVSGFGPDTDVGAWKVGDRVLVDPMMIAKGGVLGETVIGGAAEYVTVPLANLIAIPEGVSFQDAAALPIAYGTAHRMILNRGRVTAGDKVLVMGASGGVGTCCVQLAKMVGAEVAACTSSAVKGEKLRAMGADHIIDTSSENYVEATRALWGRPRVFGDGGGADVIVNYNGGESWTECFRALSLGGRLLICGATNGHDPKTDLRYIWSFEFDILGSNGWERKDLEALLKLVQKGLIKPAVDSVRPLSELATSLTDLIERRVVGKAILVP
ncbi:MAG: zinc-binding dehydrogenase [Alphaproteobacteria bacterium]|nr:zinc-binding dehydrogenase [Alphaproteobacteria bacterium]